MIVSQCSKETKSVGETSTHNTQHSIHTLISAMSTVQDETMSKVCTLYANVYAGFQLEHGESHQLGEEGVKGHFPRQFGALESASM